MKATALGGVPDLPVIVSVSVYDINPVHFLLMCCNDIEWVYKKCQVYVPKSDMVLDPHFLRLNVNDSYNQKMNLVDLSDQLHIVC